MRTMLCLLLLPSLAAAQAKSPKAQADALFREHQIVKLSIEMGNKEADALRREPRKYVSVTLKEGDAVYTEVGMHLKGAAGSFQGLDAKPGITLNMDKYHDGQLFHGLDKFHLANSVQDGSYINELICGEIMMAAGIPASRITHATVSINGRPRGFYYLKEGFDKAFLKQHFKTTNGNFYDGGFLREIDQPLQLLSGAETVKPYVDLKELNAAALEPNDNLRMQKLEKCLDLKRFISYLAVESFTWDWDGYPMNRNNYRIYHDPLRDKLVFLPSGMDQMFGNPGGPLIPGCQGIVARKLLESPEGKKRYLARMEELLENEFLPDTWFARLDELERDLKPFLGNDYAQQTRRLKSLIAERHRSLSEQMRNEKQRK